MEDLFLHDAADSSKLLNAAAAAAAAGRVSHLSLLCFCCLDFFFCSVSHRLTSSKMCLMCIWFIPFVIFAELQSEQTSCLYCWQVQTTYFLYYLLWKLWKCWLEIWSWKISQLSRRGPLDQQLYTRVWSQLCRLLKFKVVCELLCLCWTDCELVRLKLFIAQECSTPMEMWHLLCFPLSNEPVNIQLFALIGSYANRMEAQDSK